MAEGEEKGERRGEVQNKKGLRHVRAFENMPVSVYVYMRVLAYIYVHLSICTGGEVGAALAFCVLVRQSDCYDRCMF